MRLSRVTRDEDMKYRRFLIRPVTESFLSEIRVVIPTLNKANKNITGIVVVECSDRKAERGKR